MRIKCNTVFRWNMLTIWNLAGYSHTTSEYCAAIGQSIRLPSSLIGCYASSSCLWLAHNKRISLVIGYLIYFPVTLLVDLGFVSSHFNVARIMNLIEPIFIYYDIKIWQKYQSSLLMKNLELNFNFE